jgi:hypothetical protein
MMMKKGEEKEGEGKGETVLIRTCVHPLTNQKILSTANQNPGFNNHPTDLKTATVR